MIPNTSARAGSASAYVGQELRCPQELDRLPVHTIVVSISASASADPDLHQLAMQRRENLYGSLFWYPAWERGAWAHLSADDALGRFHLGPFIVVWLPPGGQP